MKLSRQKQTKRHIAALLLLLTFLPFFVIKTFHYHEEGTIVANSHTTSVQTDQRCDICLFTLSSFTEAQDFTVHFVAPFISFIFIIAVSPIIYRETMHRSLRAPPTILN